MKVTPDTKSQILHFTAENLSKRGGEFAARLVTITGCTPDAAKEEVDLSLEALFTAAAWSDKFEGTCHQPPSKRLIPTINEPMGVIGITCPNEKPLLSFITLVSAAIALGNAVVVIPSEKYPLLATDFIQILATSDVPGGVVNIVTGQRDVLSIVLAEHDSVNSVWYHGSQEGGVTVERAIGDSNLKQSWVNCGKALDWTFMARRGMFTVLLPKATQVKNIWVPWGEGTGPA
jgi:aldehyde dehydrogenase (NAD+)